MMIEVSIFYGVFLLQIGFISIYLPNMVLKRFHRVMQDYPEDKYPKLYNKSAEHYKIGASYYRKINFAIAVAGVSLLFYASYMGKDFLMELEFVFVLGFFFLQMLPSVWMEISSYSYFKQMRALNSNKLRKAELNQRKLFDYVSKKLVYAAVFSNVFCLLYVFFLDDFKLSWKGDTFVIFLTLMFMNILYYFIIRFNLHGKKQDPYQSSHDRNKQSTQIIRSLILISLIASMFITLVLTMEHYQLDAYKAELLSFYLQLVVWLSMANVLKKIPIDEIDFEVYSQSS